MNTLKAEKRSMDIKAKKFRREGFVTGNVFGRELKESIPVKFDKVSANRFLGTAHKGSEAILELEGEKMDVLVKDIEYNPLKREVEEIDFQALVKGEKVHSVAEVVLVNHEKVTDGVIEQVLSEIAYKALPSALVEKVEIDVSSMKAGDSLTVADLDIAKDKDIDITTDLDATVVTVSEVHYVEPEDDDAVADNTTEA